MALARERVRLSRYNLLRKAAWTQPSPCRKKVASLFQCSQLVESCSSALAIAIFYDRLPLDYGDRGLDTNQDRKWCLACSCPKSRGPQQGPRAKRCQYGRTIPLPSSSCLPSCPVVRESHASVTDFQAKCCRYITLFVADIFSRLQLEIPPPPTHENERAPLGC